jgi:hypothetical protein
MTPARPERGSLCRPPRTVVRRAALLHGVVRSLLVAAYLAPLLVPVLADVLHEADHALQGSRGVAEGTAAVAEGPAAAGDRGRDGGLHGGASRHAHESPHALAVVDALLKAAEAVDDGEDRVRVPTTRLAHHLPPAPALPAAEPPTLAAPGHEPRVPPGNTTLPPPLPPPRG